MPTVKDVASKALVSPGTVSNVLTGKRPVAAETRARVLQVIEELGYQPNILARSLINRRSETLAVVASGLDYYGPSQAVVGIERAADQLGYSLLLELIPWQDHAQAERSLATLAGRQVDGIIWALPEVGPNRNWITPERLKRLPPVIFLSMGPRRGVPIVAADNAAGASLATDHLIAQGRRQIGHLGGPADWWEARARHAGWQRSVAAAGLPQAASNVVIGDWTAASGERGLQELLMRQPRLDAVFAANDQMALGALRAAHLAGRRVPEDLAIAGFDNIPEAAYFWPPLTTVDQHMRDVGGAAVVCLHEMIEARLADRPFDLDGPRLLAPQLIVRASSGCAV